MTFAGKVVIVTGASSGIGASTAVLFSKEGADVVIVGRNETKLKIVTAKCEEAGKKPLGINADVSVDKDADRIIEETVKKFGKIDVLVNNAGMVHTGSILDGTILDTYDVLTRTNLRAVIKLTTLAAPYLVKSKGNVVNISSVVGIKSYTHLFGAYGISKAGLNYFSNTAAQELAPHGVRVNIISPGPVRTDIWDNSKEDISVLSNVEFKIPLNRISQPNEIGDLILFLASDKAVGITGSNYVADNGSLLT